VPRFPRLTCGLLRFVGCVRLNGRYLPDISTGLRESIPASKPIRDRMIGRIQVMYITLVLYPAGLPALFTRRFRHFVPCPRSFHSFHVVRFGAERSLPRLPERKPNV